MPLPQGHPLREGPEFSFRTRPGFDTTPTVTGVSPDQSRTDGGGTITITGTNFRAAGSGAAPTVLIDGVAATGVVVVSSTQLTAIVPAVSDTEVGAVNVSVTCGGQTGTAYGVFTYWAPTIVSVSPTYGPLAGGTAVTIIGHNFPEDAKVYFDETLATDSTWVDAQHIVCTTPAHAIGFVNVFLRSPARLFAPGIFAGAIFHTAAVAQVEYAALRGSFQFTLLVRGADIRRTPGVVIQKTLGSAPNTCTFTVDGESNVPVFGELIEIRDELDGDRLLFAGTVLTVNQVYEGLTDQLSWQVTCVDFKWLLNQRRPYGSYFNESVSDVVKDLIAKYAPGFTTNHVQTSLAKINANLDGSLEFTQVFEDFAKQIGGGHFDVDDDQDVHFFHKVPPGLELPPSAMPPLPTHMIVQAGDGIPSTFGYHPGYYALRHSFVYDDGTESALQALSDPVYMDGRSQFHVFSLPIGPKRGARTCVKRRIYYNEWSGYLSADLQGAGSIEFVLKFCEVGDNVTQEFTTWFGATGASNPIVTAIADDVNVPGKIFNGHPAGPVTAPTSLMEIFGPQPDWWVGEAIQFKYAFLYRDGSVSFPSPPSNTITQLPTKGYGIKGYSVLALTPGPALGSFDCIARLIYFSQGTFKNPNTSVGFSGAAPPNGYVFPTQFNEPDWSDAHTRGLVMLPNNFATGKVQFSLAALNSPAYTLSTGDLSSTLLYDGAVVGAERAPGNLPYNNGFVFAADPVPVWPNNDGPSLEDDDPPNDLDDANTDLLHQDAGQGFEVYADPSQIRNRVVVIGAGSTLVATAAAGANRVQVNDVASFSPAGGQYRIQDPAKNNFRTGRYLGLEGVPGAAYVTLAAPLDVEVDQGAIIVNYFQAEDLESQKFCKRFELKRNGQPTEGVHEFVIVDTSLKAAWQLFMRAYAELELFSKPLVTIKYATRDPKSTLGQTVHADQSYPPCRGDFLIQAVTIDQIRDEGDQLAPRYTVTATSTRFELNDLLLQILTNKGLSAGGVSSAGFVQSSVLASLPATTGFTGFNPVRRGVAAAWVAEREVANYETLGLTGPGWSTFTTLVIDARRQWARHTTGIVLNQNASASTQTNPGFTRFDHSPYAAVRLRTDADVTSQRLWACAMIRQGATSGGSNQPPNIDGLPYGQGNVGGDGSSNRRVIAFRYSSTYAPYWEIVMANGLDSPNGTGSRLLTTMPVLASTEYVFEISVDASSRVATCTVTNVASGTSVTRVVSLNARLFGNPDALADTLLGTQFYAGSIYTLQSGTAKQFDVGGVYLEWGNV